MIHWNRYKVPYRQIIKDMTGTQGSYFISAPLVVESVTGVKYRGFISNLNRLGLR